MTTVAPLDPESPVAKRFIETLADIRNAINARKAAAAQQTQPAPVVRKRPARKAA